MQKILFAQSIELWIKSSSATHPESKFVHFQESDSFHNSKNSSRKSFVSTILSSDFSLKSLMQSMTQLQGHPSGASRSAQTLSTVGLATLYALFHIPYVSMSKRGIQRISLSCKAPSSYSDLMSFSNLLDWKCNNSSPNKLCVNGDVFHNWPIKVHSVEDGLSRAKTSNMCVSDGIASGIASRKRLDVSIEGKFSLFGENFSSHGNLTASLSIFSPS